MASTTIDGRGTVDSSSGTGLTVQVSSSFNSTATFNSDVSMTNTPYSTAQVVAASGSITYPGVYTINNATAAGVHLPAPSTIPGGVIVFRTAGSAGQQHFLTGTAAANLGKFIVASPNSKGSKVSLETVVGSSVSLISDGLNFCVLTSSGSLVFAGN